MHIPLFGSPLQQKPIRTPRFVSKAAMLRFSAAEPKDGFHSVTQPISQVNRFLSSLQQALPTQGFEVGNTSFEHTAEIVVAFKTTVNTGPHTYDVDYKMKNDLSFDITLTKPNTGEKVFLHFDNGCMCGKHSATEYSATGWEEDSVTVGIDSPHAINQAPAQTAFAKKMTAFILELEGALLEKIDDAMP